MATEVYSQINIYRGWTNNGNTRQYWNKTVCDGCTERTLVISFIILLSFFVCLFVLCSASVSSLQIVFINILCESTAKWKTSQIFKEDIVDVCLAGGSVTKMVTIWCIQSSNFQGYDIHNHGRTSTKRNSG